MQLTVLAVYHLGEGRELSADALSVITRAEIFLAYLTDRVIVAVTGVVTAIELFVIADGHVLAAHLTVYYLGLTARGVILTVAQILSAIGTKHTLTVLAGVVAAVERLVVTKAEVIPTMLTQGMLTDVTGVVSALKHGVVVAVAKVSKAGHTFSMLTVLAGGVTAIKLAVIIKARVAAAVRADRVVAADTSGVSAIAIIMVARTHISGTIGTLIVISLLAGVVTAGEHIVIAYFKVFAADITVINHRLSTG